MISWSASGGWAIYDQSGIVFNYMVNFCFDRTLANWKIVNINWNTYLLWLDLIYINVMVALIHIVVLTMLFLYVPPGPPAWFFQCCFSAFILDIVFRYPIGCCAMSRFMSAFLFIDDDLSAGWATIYRPSQRPRTVNIQYPRRTSSHYQGCIREQNSR